jgi:hypothetical protein
MTSSKNKMTFMNKLVKKYNGIVNIELLNNIHDIHNIIYPYILFHIFSIINTSRNIYSLIKKEDYICYLVNQNINNIRSIKNNKKQKKNELCNYIANNQISTLIEKIIPLLSNEELNSLLIQK